MANITGLTHIFKQVRANRPLVHHLTNYVTANDSANIVLAIGGSPLMADSVDEIGEIIPKADSLVVNLGTLNKEKSEAIINACELANSNNIPIILDPVGVATTSLRMETAKKIAPKATVIKGNVSEIRGILGLKSSQRGVDVNLTENIDIAAVQSYSKKNNCVVAITGTEDKVIYNNMLITVRGGSEYLTKITGAGCMLSSLIGTYCGVTQKYLEATLLGIATMNSCGEQSHNIGVNKGLGSFKVALFDRISSFDPSLLKEDKFRYE